MGTDPTRLIEAIGVGAVFRSEDDSWKNGLTTAALLLAAAPTGLRYVVPGGVTLLGLFILQTLRRPEN